MLRQFSISICFGLSASLLVACGGADPAAGPEETEQASAPAPLKPEIGDWGFPLETMDLSVLPGDDFFLYANGSWVAETVIPADQTGTGFSALMRDRNRERISAIINDLRTSYPARGTDGQKIKDLYLSYLDEARIEIAGMAPFDADFTRIRSAQTHEDVVALMADAEMGIGGLISASAGLDAKQPSQGVVSVKQSGLGLPDRLFYLGKSKALDKLRAGYLDYIASVFDQLNKDFPAERARDVLALETEIAQLHWTRAEKRDVTRTYNPRSLNELEASAPTFPWTAYLAAKGFEGTERVILREETAIVGLANLFAQTPVSTWRDYLAFHYVRHNGTYMPQVFAEPHFEFFRHKLRGQQVPRSREVRAVNFVNNHLEHAVGQYYVDRHVTDEAQAQMLDMFANIKAAYRSRIEALEWMSGDTKQAALAKLDTLQGEIGYPEVRRTYDRVEIDAYELFGNVRQLRANVRALQAERLETGLDRRYWTSAPQTVNAFYNHNRNTVFVPAGYVQSPIFDPAADPALNYGGIGAIIGHEIGHAFDDRGARFDAEGRLENWWSDADRAAFGRLGNQLAKQFDGYEVLPGVFVNGRQTLGENIADLAGMHVAYDAYMLSLAGEEAPVIDGFTGAQRFFLGRAQARRYKRTEQNVRRRVISDNHSPMSLRVNGILRNMDDWYEAFGITPDHALYLPPEARVKIW
ncbi:MAG: M13 family metallopeptidase [Hyphomonadaceae bacterium]